MARWIGSVVRIGTMLPVAWDRGPAATKRRGRGQSHSAIMSKVIQAMVRCERTTPFERPVVPPVHESIVIMASPLDPGIARRNHYARSKAACEALLLELGVVGSLVGHSERRQYFGDTDETEKKPQGVLDDAALAAVLAHELHHWDACDTVGLRMVWAASWPIIAFYNLGGWLSRPHKLGGLVSGRADRALSILGWFLFWPAWVITKLVIAPLTAMDGRYHEYEADTRAAYLGRAGLKTIVLERRDLLGGAAVSEHPWPGYTVSTLSYVLSLMPPEVIKELELHRHGLTLYPLSADYYVPFPDGSHLLLTRDPAQANAEISKFSKTDAQAWPAFSAYLATIAQPVRPLLLMTPPAVRAKSPADLLELARFAWRLQGLDVQPPGDFVKVMTLSVAELLDEWFESPQVKAARCVSGAIGTYGGPYTPGTAYVLLHHYIGEVDGQMAAWAFVRGGTGAVSEAIAADAREHGAEDRGAPSVLAKRLARRHGWPFSVLPSVGHDLPIRAPVACARTICAVAGIE